jgi:hypothetical protein
VANCTVRERISRANRMGDGWDVDWNSAQWPAAVLLRNSAVLSKPASGAAPQCCSEDLSLSLLRVATPSGEVIAAAHFP